MKYEEWAQNWLQYKIKPTTKQWTYERYKILMRRHILPKLGASELEDLTAFELQKFTVGLTERGLSANTVNGILSVLKTRFVLQLCLALRINNIPIILYVRGLLRKRLRVSVKRNSVKLKNTYWKSARQNCLEFYCVCIPGCGSESCSL